jgi:hypothetical protein
LSAAKRGKIEGTARLAAGIALAVAGAVLLLAGQSLSAYRGDWIRTNDLAGFRGTLFR